MLKRTKMKITGILGMTAAMALLAPVGRAAEAGNGKVIEVPDFRIATFEVWCWDAGVRGVKGEGVSTIIKTTYQKENGHWCEGNLVYYDPSKITGEQLAERMKKGCRGTKWHKTDLEKPEGIESLTLNTPWITEGDCLQFVLATAPGRSFDVSFKNLPKTWKLDGARDGVLAGLSGETVINVQSDRALRPGNKKEQEKEASVTLVLKDLKTGKETELTVPFRVVSYRGSHSPDPAQAKPAGKAP